MSYRDPPDGRIYGGETQAERKARRHRQFLEAGLEVFGQVGYRQATVRQLCRQAQLTDRYFYEAFGSTEDLLIAVYLDCIARIREGVMERLTQAHGGSIETLIRSGLDAFFAVIEDARLARVVWLEVLGISPRVDQTYTECVRGFADLLLQLAQAVYPQLDRKHELHRITAVGVIGGVSEAAKQWLLSDYREPRATMVEATAPLFLGMTQYLTSSLPR
jgi:AcrR family transcriptional regulator